MPDKIRIVGAFAEDVVDKVQAFIKELEGIETVQVLRDGVDIFPHPDEEAAAAAHAPAEEPATAEGEPAPAPAEEAVTAPPTPPATEEDRRVGPADRRQAQVAS
jgi:hypothetical protein